MRQVVIEVGQGVVAAVDDDLHRGGAPGVELGGEAMVDLHGGLDPAVVDQVADFAAATEGGDDVDVARLLQAGDQFPARHAAVEVEDGGVNVNTVERLVSVAAGGTATASTAAIALRASAGVPVRGLAEAAMRGRCHRWRRRCRCA